jgi:hypothetical protein
MTPRWPLLGFSLLLLALSQTVQASEGSVLLSFQGMESLRQRIVGSLWELEARVIPTRSEFSRDTQISVVGQAVAFRHPVHGVVLMHSLDLTKGAEILVLKGPGNRSCTPRRRFQNEKLNLGFVECAEELVAGDAPELAGAGGIEPELYFSVDNPRGQFPSIFHQQGRAFCEAPLYEFLCIPIGALFSSPLFDSEGRLAGITLRRLGLASKLSITVSAAQLRALRFPPRRPPTLEDRPHPNLKRPFVF